MKIRKGDTVKILSGKDKGKEGKVLRVHLKNSKVTVEGVNVFKKHVRPKKQGEKGEVVSVVRPLNVSNAMLICPACKRGTRVGFRIQDGKKIRHCRRCQSNI